MASHPEVVEEVLEEGKSENGIPYKAEILEKIDEELRVKWRIQQNAEDPQKPSGGSFIKAIERCAVRSTTLWGIDYPDKVNQELKALIGNDLSRNSAQCFP